MQVCGKLTDEWLKQYEKKSSKYIQRKRLTGFLEWANLTDEVLKETFDKATDKYEWARGLGKRVIEFYNDMIAKGYSVNHARSFVSGIRAFCRDMLSPLKIPRKKIPKTQVATKEHEFTLSLIHI